jgi:hypothetical protein
MNRRITIYVPESHPTLVQLAPAPVLHVTLVQLLPALLLHVILVQLISAPLLHAILLQFVPDPELHPIFVHGADVGPGIDVVFCKLLHPALPHASVWHADDSQAPLTHA